MTVVLHIGTHKTGSTAIQRFAASNRVPLRARGLWYPSYEEIGVAAHYGHHHLSHAIANDSGNRLSADDARRFVDLILSGKRPEETVLISAEPLYRHVLPAEGGYWKERKAYIDRLRTFFPTPDIKILAVLRRQDTFARSLYQERVKVTKYSLTFGEFIEDRKPFQYYKHLMLFQEAFGSVDVLLYEDLASDGLLEGFFGHLGIGLDGLTNRRRTNQSLPIDLVEFKRILNTTPLKLERLKEIGALLVERAEQVALPDAGPVDWLPVAAMADFCASFEEENERLRRDLLPARSGPLFPPFARPADGAAPAVYGGMSTRRFAQLVAEFLL